MSNGSFICPCGVNMTKHPHSSKICAPTLPERLRKMAAWIDKQPKTSIICGLTVDSYYSLSCGNMDSDECFTSVTAFPGQMEFVHNCVYCGVLIIYPGSILKLQSNVGKYEAFLCSPCFTLNRRLCSFSMECAEKCKKKNRDVLREVKLCLLRIGLTRDVRRLLYEWVMTVVCCK